MIFLMGGCSFCRLLKALRTHSDQLRVSGGAIEIVNKKSFVVSLSNHVKDF